MDILGSNLWWCPNLIQLLDAGALCQSCCCYDSRRSCLPHQAVSFWRSPLQRAIPGLEAAFVFLLLTLLLLCASMDNSTATTAAANATVDIVKQLAEAADGLTTEQLTLLVAVVPHADLLEATPTTLHAIYDLVTAQTNIATVWAPDLWAITALFIICLVLKIFGALMTTKKQVERVQETGVRSEQSLVTFANAETLLEKPARSALGHLMNLTVST